MVEMDEPPQKFTTSVVKDTNSPFWDEQFLLYVLVPSFLLHDFPLQSEFLVYLFIFSFCYDNLIALLPPSFVTELFTFDFSSLCQYFLLGMNDYVVVFLLSIIILYSLLYIHLSHHIAVFTFIIFLFL